MVKRVVAVTVAALALSASAAAAEIARNLVATPAVKAQLRQAFIATHRMPASSVRGPLRGSTYYGSYRGYEYALAVFSISRFGAQDQPEVFKRRARARWRDLGDTGGEVCPPTIPLPLIKVWRLVPTSKTRVGSHWVQCYGYPRR